MRPVNLIALVALALGANAACHSNGASSGPGGLAGASSGAAGAAGAAALEGGAGASGSLGPDAQAPSEGGASDGSSDGVAGSSGGGAVGADEPTFPFDIGAAETILGEQIEPTRETIDTQTIEYLLTGSTITAEVDKTRWATPGEAEFECQRAAGTGATLVVGPDYTMFAASDAIELARDVYCTRIRVVSDSVYSAPLTTAFADVIRAPP